MATEKEMLFTLQRYKFLSKSQPPTQEPVPRLDVVYLAKVQISKQITTFLCKRLLHLLMLFTLQRYKFLSKSQQAEASTADSPRCCLPCKGTNF